MEEIPMVLTLDGSQELWVPKAEARDTNKVVIRDTRKRKCVDTEPLVMNVTNRPLQNYSGNPGRDDTVRSTQRYF